MASVGPLQRSYAEPLKPEKAAYGFEPGDYQTPDVAALALASWPYATPFG